MASKNTPMMTQYFEIKSEYEDAILFFRMGDFYEMFFEDAKIASRALEITLTSRNKQNDEPVPMCGIPVKSVDGYIAKLIEKDLKVAICEQVEDAQATKGIVRREVVRVVTPGMILDETLLDARSNNYVLAVSKRKTKFGVAYIDISTGTFRLSESSNLKTVLDEVYRVDPKEIVLPGSAETDESFSNLVSGLSGKYLSYVDDTEFSLTTSKEQLLAQFKTRSLEGYGCAGLKSGICAAGAVLSYVADAQKQNLAHVVGLETYHLESYLVIDELSCRNLELTANMRNQTRTGTLLEVMDQTATAMGSRLLNMWLRYPLLDVSEITNRLDAVEELFNSPGLRDDIRQNLKQVADMERLGGRLAMGRGTARDLLALKRSLMAFPGISDALKDSTSPFLSWEGDFTALSELAGLIEEAIREDAPPTIQEGGIFRTGFNSELDELINISTDGKSYLARLEASERELSGINTLKVKYNRVFGYFIEVSKAASKDVPAHYVRKQTLVNTERYITDELKTFETRVLNAEDERHRLELSMFNDIRETVMSHHEAIAHLSHFIARLDTLSALAEVAVVSDYCRPSINTDGRLQITDGRHPVVEKMIVGERYVPNTVTLDNETQQVMVITGPNMAGKSTVLRQVALTTLLTQVGSFVPAASADVCITDRIFTRVGAADNLAHGQSTFMVEMEETANILNNATPDSLVIMDEIGRGTSTFDGISIAWAVAEYLHDLKGKGVKTLFATHYHELTDLARTKDRVINSNIAVKEWNDEIIFLRKLVEGGTNRSYGIQVARLAGVPQAVIKKSKKILARIETGDHDLQKIAGTQKPKKTPIREEKQLSLFRKPENIVIESLKELDISSMTPLDALNKLHELSQKAKNISANDS